jgi:hypothetical protein
VRRHRGHCPKRLGTNDCHGELVWSAPSEGFRIAAQNDLVGTSNNAVTVQLPDIGELLAQAAGSGPQPRAGGLRTAAPPGSSLDFSVDGTTPSGGQLGGPGFCSFAIPLITIIAMFLINLVLPILMLLFGLWALLALRFCIPPSLQLSAGLTAQLDLAGELGVDVDVDAFVDVDGNLVTPASLRAALVGDFDTAFGAGAGAGMTGPQGAEPPFSNSALAELRAGLLTDRSAQLDLRAGLHYEDEPA